MQILLENEHWTITRHPSRPLYIVLRTGVGYARLEQIEPSFQALEAALDAHGRRGIALLIDMRVAIARNDPEFEHASTTHPGRFARGFTRAATLVRSAAGLLQTQRYFRERGANIEVFADEPAALAYLAGAPLPQDAASAPSTRRRGP